MAKNCIIIRLNRRGRIVGLVRALGERISPQGDRGFESRPLRFRKNKNHLFFDKTFQKTDEKETSDNIGFLDNFFLK